MVKRIGVFDSGIGGFSILRHLFVQLGQCDFYYVADSEFCPYGDKDEEQIKKRSFEITEMLIEKGVDIIVLACNTATAHAIDDLRTHFQDYRFIGVEPYINAINKLESVDVQHSWVSMTTLNTSKSKRYLDLLKNKDGQGKIQTVVIPELASLIENLYHFPDQQEKILDLIKKSLSPLSQIKIDNLILGCTHYPLIENILRDFTGAKIIDPSHSIALHTSNTLKIYEDKSTDFPENFQFFDTKIKQWQSIARNHLDLFSQK